MQPLLFIIRDCIAERHLFYFTIFTKKQKLKQTLVLILFWSNNFSAFPFAVPMSIFILSLPLPYIPQGARLNFWFVFGTGILVVGLMLYNLPKSANQFDESD